MQNPAIFAATLGLSHPWRITSISISKDVDRIDIHVECAFGSTFKCPSCGKMVTPLNTRTECWYHQDFLRHKTYLHATVPSLSCICCGEFQPECPWARRGSKFTKIELN